MKFLLAAILTFVAVAGLAQTDEEVVRTLSEKKFQWLIAGKADSLDRVLDERVQYIHSNGWTQNKKEVIEDMRSGKLVYQKVTVKESMVRIYREAAVVTGLGTFEGINSGTPFKLELRYSEVYFRTGGKWLLVSRHANRMP